MTKNNKNKAENNKIIPHNRPFFNLRDERKVAKILKSAWVARGGECRALERSFDKYLLNHENSFIPERLGKNKIQSLAVSSGTAALFIALKTLSHNSDSHNSGSHDYSYHDYKSPDSGIKNEVIFPAYTCSAVLNAVKHAGLKPVFCDINPLTLNPEPENYTKMVTNSTLCAIITHSHGFPADSPKIISALSAMNKRIFIIEDCCQSLGSKINNIPCGSFGDASVFSFHATKIITGGSGGLIFFKNQVLRDKALDYINYDMPANNDSRFNFLLSDINAGLADSQFSRLNKFIQFRKMAAKAYKEIILSTLQNFSPEYPFPCTVQNSYLNCYRFVFFISPHLHEKFIHLMQGQNITVINPFLPKEQLYLLDINLKSQITTGPLQKNIFPGSIEACSKTMSLPVHPSMKTRGLKRVCSALKYALNNLY